ncbi:sodium/proton antiporter (CPA1 family) [Ornithinimicrobium humiphilum]|uniref:Sodium/proton antiporter (CPA1 family) n=1 Tax=Ornithinimicrobium humiphilum TaxID=125288 RepID=A0A543KM60_9MICO|nr:cation:proton antiporter [Ornithinimicrobium humiphilum]TQM96156.1 sodium/proton antiporter (CPA1 family) [Ornithinimicrobium humiphilum]
MDVLGLLIALMLGTIAMVSVGERLRLPWPALMVLLAMLVGLVPAWREISIDPHLILPLFLPPLLYATAQRTSWALFRHRWRAVVGLALILTAVTIATVAGTVAAIVPGVTLAAAIAIGAAVAPPDPVAVEAVAGPVGIPRRLTATLQSEGLFNDAVAIVVFTAAVSATQTDRPFGLDIVGEFLLGLVLAVAIGLAAAWGASWLGDHVGAPAGRNAITLVLPFAVYVLAEEVHASGVVAVVVTAVQMASMRGEDEVEERLTGKAFWDVVELLVTGVAFGLVGIEVYHVVVEAGDELTGMLGRALVVSLVVIGTRALWMAGVWLARRRSTDESLPVRTWKEAVLLTWSGMRGLATLALALAIPTVAADGTPIAIRDELLVIAAAVVVATLVLPAFTLPWLVRALALADDHGAERRAELQLARRASRAAVASLREREGDVPEEILARVEESLRHLDEVLAGEAPEEHVERVRELSRLRAVANDVRRQALVAARAEVLRARQEPGVDPEVADRVLRELDLRTPPGPLQWTQGH